MISDKRRFTVTGNLSLAVNTPWPSTKSVARCASDRIAIYDVRINAKTDYRSSKCKQFPVIDLTLAVR